MYDINSIFLNSWNKFLKFWDAFISFFYSLLKINLGIYMFHYDEYHRQYQIEWKVQ